MWERNTIISSDFRIDRITERQSGVMKALMKVAKGKGNLEICDILRPKIKNEDDVLIEVTAAGVCGTDIHIWRDEFPYYPPVVMGHEFAGIVRKTGKSVTRFSTGDLVVGEPHTHFCGKCEMCRAGKIQLCAHKRSPGWGIDGAFTDYLVMPELFLHHVPEGVDSVTAALCEPLAIVTTGVLEHGKIGPQDTVAIVGAGPIGLLSAVAAKSGGAAKVVVLGTDADEAVRFPAARKLGADQVINVQRENAKKLVDSLTSGRGVDIVVEASGAAEGINTAADIVKQCGKITVVGMPGEEKLSIKWLEMIHKVLDVNFNFSSSVSSWERALSIMKTTPYDLSAVITHKVNISNWEQAFDDIAIGNAIKVMFIPRQETYDIG